MLSALLRLLPLEKGTILLDGVDISAVADPDKIRSRFITLPQDPVLIGGTVRHNLHLYSYGDEGGGHPGSVNQKITDDHLISTLDSFGLWETIHRKGGLDANMTEDVLSHGQRQLFCLARATLLRGRGRNVVILDEPTSQADPETEGMIEAAVRDRFGGGDRTTVLCVAHRLSTILEFDVVLVMDAGVVVERGNPRALLRDRASAFTALMRNQTSSVQGQGQI